MFKCEFCGKEFSPTVLSIHQKICGENPNNKVREVNEVKEVKKELKKGAK